VPGGQGIPIPGIPPRLNEAFEAIKQEFEAIASDVELVKGQKEDVEVKRMSSTSHCSSNAF